MAANNNLTDFLTSVADAIRKKKLSSDPINPQEFANEIESIQGGGGSGFDNLNISGVVADPTIWEIKNIKKIRFSDGVKEIKEMVRTFTHLEELYIPSSVETITLGVTSGCTYLKKIEVDMNNVTYESPNDCNAIINTAKKSIVAGCKETIIPNGIKEIGFGAFQTQPIETINIPEGVENIAAYAFYGSFLIESKFPSTIKTLQINAFGACKSAKLYDFRKLTSIPSISTYQVFVGIPEDCKIVVPDDLLVAWKAESNWSDLASHIISATDYDSNGIL